MYDIVGLLRRAGEKESKLLNRYSAWSPVVKSHGQSHHVQTTPDFVNSMGHLGALEKYGPQPTKALLSRSLSVLKQGVCFTTLAHSPVP